MALQAPFPVFGGKSTVTAPVWRRFGKPNTYVEPFCRSAAMLLGSPHWPHTKVIETVNDAEGHICLAPETKLLDSTLRWVQAGSVSIGDELIGFDEFNGEAREGFRAPKSYRKWQRTTVTAVKRVAKPSYRLTFDDGTVVVASEDHMWLSGSHTSGGKRGGRGWRWVKTSSLVCNRKTQRSWVLKLCDVVHQDTSYESGWVSGFLDGEGHVQFVPGWSISATQRVGPELDRFVEIVSGYGFGLRVGAQKRRNDNHKDVRNVHIGGGMRETLKALMMFRPERLIRNVVNKIENASLYGRKHQAVGLVSKEYLGECEVVAIETDTHTFIAEGLASHNCNFWRAVKADPEAVAHYASNPVHESTLHAAHTWLTGMRSVLSARLEGDLDYYDAKVAGWWVWGASCWIGQGWCAGNGAWSTEIDDEGYTVLVKKPSSDGVSRQRQQITSQQGIFVTRQVPRLSAAGQGVNRSLPELASQRGVSLRKTESLVLWMQDLADRFRDVRVLCGDWSRAVTPSVTTYHGTVAMFLDPPYDGKEREMGLYPIDSGTVASDTRTWCLENGNNPQLRIALCGYSEHDELEHAGWEKFEWKANGGFGNQGKNTSRGKDNAKKEVIWFSPHCLKEEYHQPGMLDL